MHTLCQYCTGILCTRALSVPGTAPSTIHYASVPHSAQYHMLRVSTVNRIGSYSRALPASPLAARWRSMWRTAALADMWLPRTTSQYCASHSTVQPLSTTRRIAPYAISQY
eukprot:2793416-Rhodomonas_salina.3